LPDSTSFPASITQIVSAFFIDCNLCATTMTVLWKPRGVTCAVRSVFWSMFEQLRGNVHPRRNAYRPCAAFCSAFSTSASLTASREDVASVRFIMSTINDLLEPDRKNPTDHRAAECAGCVRALGQYRGAVTVGERSVHVL